MEDQEPTIRSRELGGALRAAMEQAGLNGKQLCGLLDWSEPKLSRLLTGRRGAPESEVSALLTACGVSGQRRRRLLALCQDQDRRSWFQQRGAGIPNQVRTYVDHEDKADRITCFQTLVVPGVLQTSDYARALLNRSSTVPADEIDERTAIRAGRQVILSRRDCPSFTFYLHEFVLRLPVGDRVVMSGQLHRLLRESARPRISVRVIPAAAGAHAGSAGSFTLLESSAYQPVVYLEGEVAGVFLAKPEEVGAYRRVLAGLASVALDEQNSRELIATVATEDHGDGRDERH